MLEIQEKKAKDEPYLALVMVIHLRYVTKDRPYVCKIAAPTTPLPSTSQKP